MEEYDEDLSENPWYLAFVHGQSKLFAEITGERWIVCVPKCGSWKGHDDLPKTISASNFQSHCMKYDGEESSATTIVNGIDVTKKIHRYVTHNGKILLIEGSKVSCGPGFEESATSFNSKSGLLDLPPSGLNHHVRILFEETYFNENDQSYKMLCLSRPLELHLVSEQEPEKKDEALSHLTEGVQMGKSHLSSQQLWNKASKPEKLKRIIDGKIASYIKYHGVGKMTVANSASNQRKSESLELDEITGLEACEAAVNFLFKVCLDIVKKDSKIKKEIDGNPSDATDIAVEKYVLQEVYGSVSRQIASSVADQEASFNKKICNLSDVQPRDLEIDEKYWLSLPRAKRHISRMNKCCTPYDKVACIQRTISCITAKQELPKDEALGSDDLLPILIYLVIKSGVPNWITNLVYLKRFKFVPSKNEQSSYFVATLEAAVEHINSAEFKPSSKMAAEKLGDDIVHDYFKCVQDGDVDGVRHILLTGAFNQEEIERKFCHPLCDCEECSKLKRSKSLMRTEIIVSINTKNEKGQTALHVAALLGRHELVDILLDLGAQINDIDYHGSTPLHCAAWSGSQSVVCAKAILYFDPSVQIASINMDNDDGDTPLHVASRWGYVGIVSALMESGADPKAVNRRRQSAVDVSLNENVSHIIKDAASQVIKIVRTLKYLKNDEKKEVHAAMSPQKSRSRAATPKELDNAMDLVYVAKQVEKLFRAINDNDLNMVRFLCGWQASNQDGSSKNRRDSTCHPLCQCVKCQPLTPDLVLHANSANQEKYTGIMLAAKHGYLEMTKLFLVQGANPNARTKKHGYSPLYFACESGKVSVLKAVLSADGINPDIRDENGSTPLYVCAINNFVECASLLMEHNASLNIRNRKGDTPLHIAVKWKNLEIITLFLEHGALLYYKNHDELTPLDLAEKDSEMKTLLLQTGSITKSCSLTSCEASTGISPHSISDQDWDTDTDVFMTQGKKENEFTPEEAAVDPVCCDLQNSCLPKSPTNLIDSMSLDRSQYSDTSNNNCDCPKKVLSKLPSTTSDIFHDIGVERTQEPDATVTLISDGENEMSLLLSKEPEHSSPVSGTVEVEEGVSEELCNSDRYFEMG